MVNFQGKFRNVKDEGLDEYYAAIGVPWVARKMMVTSHPDILISCTDDVWTVKVITLLSTVENTFRLGEEYEEHMFGGRVLKNVTTIEGDKIITISKGPRGEAKRVIEFPNDNEFVLVLSHEKTDLIARRYFTRIE